MSDELRFTARGKSGPTIKLCKDLYAETRKKRGGTYDNKKKVWVGGNFGIRRIVRTGAKYLVVLDNTSGSGLSLDQFINKLTK